MFEECDYTAQPSEDGTSLHVCLYSLDSIQNYAQVFTRDFQITINNILRQTTPRSLSRIHREISLDLFSSLGI